MTVVFAGQCRNAGKTTAMCSLLSATRELGWTAVKLSGHEHDPGDGGDTARYLAAGAQRALLLRTPDELPDADYLMVESNTLAQQRKPDLLFYVAAPDNPDIKGSARGLQARADAVLIGTGGVAFEHIQMLRRAIVTAKLRS